MNKLKELNIAALEGAKEIGCPFLTCYGGEVAAWGSRRAAKESVCAEACGKLFPLEYRPHHCPCWHLGRAYAKKHFWEKLCEAAALPQKGD